MYSNFHGMFLTVRNVRLNPKEGRKTKLWSLPIHKYRRATSEEEEEEEKEEEYACTKAFD